MSPRACMLASALVLLAACARPAPEAVEAPTDAAQPVMPQPPPSTPPVDATPVAQDWTLPGAFAPDTTVDQLRARFGGDNVRIVDDLPMAEGETTRGVILFADDPQRRARLYFNDVQALRGLQLVAIEDSQSRWHFADGLRMGMTLAELARANGKPVTYSGLDWDYGGHAGEWNGGRFATCPPPAHCSRSVRLSANENAPADSYPIGDSTYSSDDPRWPKAGQLLKVSELMLSLPGEDDL